MCLGTHQKISPVLGHSAIDASLLKATAAVKEQQHQSKNQNVSSSEQQNKRRKGGHIVVQHAYHDHANDYANDVEHPARGGVSTPFPIKLHEMLEGVKADDQEDIVSWQPHGRCFVVHKPKEFVKLLPRYFKLSKLASFQRQLNLYGFQRLTRGRDRGGYYNELFLRGKKFLAHDIQRMKVKGTGVRARSNPDQEPDFWSMVWIGEDNNKSNPHIPIQTKPRSEDSLVAPLTLSFPPPSFDTQPSSYPSEGRIMLKSQVVPIVYPHSLRHLIPTEEKKKSTDETEEDIVCSFGNKTFHYLDPFQPLSLNEDDSHKTPCPTAIENEDFLDIDADCFFQGFDFPETIGTEIENDAVFGDMLESLIS